MARVTLAEAFSDIDPELHLVAARRRAAPRREVAGTPL